MAAGALVCLAVLLTDLVSDRFFYLLGPIMLLLVVALPALHVRQAGRSGWLGLVGCVLATMSAAVLAALMTVASVAQIVFGFDPEEYGAVFWVLMVGLFTFVVGVALFGIDTARVGVLPRWGAVLLAIGLPAVFMFDLFTGAFFGGEVHPLGTFVGFPIFAVGLIWLGYALWARRDTSASNPRT